MEFTEIAENEFVTFAEAHPQFSFFQTPAIANYRAKRGWEKHYVALKENQKIIAATMMLSKPAAFKKKVFYAPRGPLIDYENPEVLKTFFKKLKTYIRKRNGYIFRFDPYFEYQERDIDGKIVAGGYNHEQAIKNLENLKIKIDPHPDQIKWMFALDLDKSIDELKKAFKSNTRNLINKALKSGIKIRELKKDELKDFYKMCSATAKRKGFEHENKPLEYYEDFYDFFKKDIKYWMAELNIAEYQKTLKSQKRILEKTLVALEESPVGNCGRIKEAKITIDGINKRLEKAEKIKEEDGEKIQLSCGMFILSGKREIVYLIAGNAEKYLDLNAQYLIQWEIINFAKKHKYERYNFYGISGNFDKSNPAYGMYEFKKGFGGYVVELIGGFEMPVTSFYYLHKMLSKLH